MFRGSTVSKANRRLRVFVKHVINPLFRRVARLSHGPFALLRHTGRKSGKAYEIPIMVWRDTDGFVIVLTYGPQVDWLRNLQAASQGTLNWHRREYIVRPPIFIDEQTAQPVLPALIRRVLAARGTHAYVKLIDWPAPSL
jgi:deazaflavin-dependent oxidoreductase (nitroreductase family)